MSSPTRKTPLVRQERLRLKRPTMPAPAVPSSKRTVWLIPFTWFAEESFWRDVAKSAVSTGTVALIAYLYALAVGYVATPPGVSAVVIALSTLSLVLMVLAARAIYLRSFRAAWVLLAIGFSLYLAMVTIDLTRNDGDEQFSVIASNWAMTMASLMILASFIFITAARRGKTPSADKTKA